MLPIEVTGFWGGIVDILATALYRLILKISGCDGSCEEDDILIRILLFTIFMLILMALTYLLIYKINNKKKRSSRKIKKR